MVTVPERRGALDCVEVNVLARGKACHEATDDVCHRFDPRLHVTDNVSAFRFELRTEYKYRLAFGYVLQKTQFRVKHVKQQPIFRSDIQVKIDNSEFRFSAGDRSIWKHCCMWRHCDHCPGALYASTLQVHDSDGNLHVGLFATPSSLESREFQPVLIVAVKHLPTSAYAELFHLCARPPLLWMQ